MTLGLPMGGVTARRMLSGSIHPAMPKPNSAQSTASIGSVPKPTSANASAEHEQDAAEHHRRAAAIGQRTQRQQRGDVHDLREHEQPRDAGPVESELATAAQRNGELLDGRVAHGDRGAGRRRQRPPQRRQQEEARWHAACTHRHRSPDKEMPMPPKGVKSRKRARQYEKVLKSIKSEGRYKGRQKEVAARIVNKTRRNKGETRSRRQRRSGQRKAA